MKLITKALNTAYDKIFTLEDGERKSMAELFNYLIGKVGGSPNTTASEEIVIPHIDFELSSNYVTGDGETPTVSVYFRATPHTKFLDHNPEVWLYRYKRGRKNEATGVKTSKKFVHPVHQLGEKYPGSHLYSGMPSVTNVYQHENDPKIPLLPPPSRETEWLCPTSAFERIKLAADWNKWFTTYGKPTQKSRLSAYNRSYREVFKFGIVIDNPDLATKTIFPKLHGPLSTDSMVMFMETTSDPVYDENGNIINKKVQAFINDKPYERR